jgi:tetratricopeptide (TPR) repeat protein
MRHSWTVSSIICCLLQAGAASCPPTWGQVYSSDFTIQQADLTGSIQYYNLGNRLLEAGRYEEAAHQFRQAIARNDRDPDYYINLGVASRKMEDYANAQWAFEQAIKLNPKDWMSWSNLGNAFLKQDRLKETIGAFEKAMTCNPPATEKAAMIKDIADIKKILVARGQLPPPGQKLASKGTTKERTQPKAPKASKLSSVSPKTPTAVPQGAPEQTNLPTTDWGY